jgi:hypothetical protein
MGRDPHAEDPAVSAPSPYRSLSALCAVASALTLLSCTSSGTQSAHEKHLGRIEQGSDAEVTRDGLHRVRTPRSYGLLYLKAPRPHLYRYQAIGLAPISITYKRGFKPWKSDTESRLRHHIATSIVGQLEEQVSWQLVDKAGPGVLVLMVYALELDLSPIEMHTHDGTTRTESAETGDVILMLELRDSMSGEPLVRFIQNQALPGGSYSGSDVEYQRVRRAFDRFADRAALTVAELHAGMEEIRTEEARSAP